MPETESMKTIFHNSQIKFFILGIAVTLFCVLFIGAINSPPPPNYGRFQLQSWATSLADGGALVGAFVIDTATGETKTVLSRQIKSGGKSITFKNELKKQFLNIK